MSKKGWAIINAVEAAAKGFPDDREDREERSVPTDCGVKHNPIHLDIPLCNLGEVFEKVLEKG